MHSSPTRAPRAGLRRTALVTLLVAVAAAGHAAERPDPSPVIDADEFVVDRTQAEWLQAYLQWVAAFPRASSPVSDTTGARCGARQQGEVWFLAGSDGTAPIERSCVVPAGRTLFVPVANILERSGNREPVCDSMARLAADNLARHVNALSMTVDGRDVDALAGHRLRSGGCFALGLRQSPPVNAKTAVADGYAVLLRPLQPGTHTLVIQARFDNVPVSTTYHLDVR